MILPFVAVLALPLAAAPVRSRASAPAGEFRTKFIGEGGSGSYTHPSPDASGVMEESARQDGAAAYPGGVPVPRETPAPLPSPVALPPSASVAPAYGETPVRPAVPQEASAFREVPPEPIRTERERRRYSLWEGLSAPLALPGHKVKDVSLDQAQALGRRDYDTHILGQGAASDRAAAWGVAPPAGPPSGAEVFVVLNLDLKKNSQPLKDAVADLGRVAGFRQDLRFEPAAVGAGPDQVALWGWLPSDGIGPAMSSPVVARLELAGPARRPRPRLAADVLIGLRLGARSVPEEAVSRLEAELGGAGLRVKRAIGTQAAPGSGEPVLVLEVSMPFGALGKLMAHTDVVKIVPAPQPAPPAPRAPASPIEACKRFLAYAAENYPLLLVLTLLMLLPSVGDRLVSAARVFIPYR